MRALVEAAAARYREPGAGVVPFTARIESEIGVLLRQPNGEEILTGVEQIAGQVTWSGGGDLVQSLTAYRSRFSGPALSTLTYIRGPWVVAPLAGDRVPLVLAADPPPRPEGEDTTALRPATGVEATDASGRRREMPSMVNPLGSDRAAYYRFSGGDTVLTLRLPTRTIPVVRIAVEPSVVSADVLLFRGEIHLDAIAHGVVRLRGEVLARARPRRLLSRVVRATMEPHLFLDLENELGERGGWLPHRQWIELEAGSPLTDESATVRIVTDFSATTPDSTPSPGAAGSGPGGKRTLLRLEADSTARRIGWRMELGAATAERSPLDLTDLRALRQRRGVRFGTRALAQAVRYDRVEGLFTGGGLRAGGGAGEAGPFAALHAGWAWSEGTARGGAEVGVAGRGWQAAVGAGRELASTNDFPRPFTTGPTIFGVLGADDLDYVDRYSTGLRASFVHRRGAAIQGDVQAVRDRAASTNVERAPLGSAFEPLRATADGDYARIGVTVAFSRGSGGEFLTPGWSAQLSWEMASGDLAWQRVEGSVRARRQLGRWSGSGEAFGGVVTAADPPPQALFEIGGYTSRLPGYPVKAFTGDRAAVGMLEAAYALPLLETPIRIGPVFLPSPAPSPLAQLSAGWTGASGDAASVLSANGWEPSDGIRATAFLGVRLFSGFVRVGAARPLGEHGRWRFEVGAGG
ncbi:MAG TPA: hypothetical protein VLH75_03740 [Longimicrobiales bacterium]|nr:hypothetical protein [Longimicrobiales bacterium]